MYCIFVPINNSLNCTQLRLVQFLDCYWQQLFSNCTQMWSDYPGCLITTVSTTWIPDTLNTTNSISSSLYNRVTELTVRSNTHFVLSMNRLLSSFILLT